MQNRLDIITTLKFRKKGAKGGIALNQKVSILTVNLAKAFIPLNIGNTGESAKLVLYVQKTVI